MSTKKEALRRIRTIIARCLNNNKKPTKDEMFSILNWCSSGLNDWPATLTNYARGRGYGLSSKDEDRRHD